MKVRLTIVATHPIQYYAPWFRELARHECIDLRVFYLWDGGGRDPDFNKSFEWDIPLLDGYDHSLVRNTSGNPGTHRFSGLVNPSLRQELADWKPDAVLMMAWAYRSTIELIVRGLPCKPQMLFRGDSHLLGLSKKKRGRSCLSFMLKRFVYSRFDVLLNVGKANRKMLLHHGVKPYRIFFTPHFVDHGRFSDSDHQKSASDIREKLGIKKNDTAFLFAGKLIKKKQPELLLHTFMKLNRPDCHLIFCGSGELEETLKSQASDHSRIHFLDFVNQSQMPPVYHASDVIVLPSKGNRETWGLCINEAFSCGLPAIVSNHTGCYPDLIKSGKTGFVFRHSNGDGANDANHELLEQMNRLATDLSLRDTMSKHCKAHITRYSMHEATEGLLCALERGRSQK